MTDAYTYQADMYCEECAEKITAAIQHDLALSTEILDDHAHPQGPFPNGGGEADSPQHCGSCGLFLENPLTDDGQEYVQEQIEYAEMGGSEPAVIEQWKAFYDYLTIRS